MSARRLRAVFFDVGGTLLQPWPSVGAVYARVGERHGFHASPAQMEAAFREAWRRSPRTGSGLTSASKDWWRQLVFGALDALGLAGDRQQRTACFEELYAAFARPDAWRVFPDVGESLRAARARGLHLGLISNWDERLRWLLTALKLTDWDSVTISCEVGAEKPSAAIFQAALQAARIEPAAALHVGDSYDDDILGAQAVGLTAVLIDRDGRAADRCPTIRDLRDLARWWAESTAV